MENLPEDLAERRPYVIDISNAEELEEDDNRKYWLYKGVNVECLLCKPKKVMLRQSLKKHMRNKHSDKSTAKETQKGKEFKVTKRKIFRYNNRFRFLSLKENLERETTKIAEELKNIEDRVKRLKTIRGYDGKRIVEDKMRALLQD